MNKEVENTQNSNVWDLENGYHLSLNDLMYVLVMKSVSFKVKDNEVEVFEYKGSKHFILKRDNYGEYIYMNNKIIHIVGYTLCCDTDDEFDLLYAEVVADDVSIKSLDNIAKYFGNIPIEAIEDLFKMILYFFLEKL